MIRGLGIDLVDVVAFRAQLADPASAFLEGTFTPAERRESASRPSGDAARHLAGRFAAKEAFVKAWSSANFGGAPVLERADLREVEVRSDAFGRPALRLRGRLEEKVAESGVERTWVSISHDGEAAVAVVVLEG